jgi:hypothetical protein
VFKNDKDRITPHLIARSPAEGETEINKQLKLFTDSDQLIVSHMLTGPPREFLGLRAKGNLAPSSNSPNNDTHNKLNVI